jgi:hypothetical protein
MARLRAVSITMSREADRHLKFDALNSCVIETALHLSAAEIEVDHLQQLPLGLRFSATFDTRRHCD